MKKLLLIFSISPIFLFSQIDITGNVKNERNELLDFYEVIFLNPDSTIFFSNTFFNDNFSIELKTPLKDSIHILIRSFEYKDFSKIVLLNKSLNIGNITLKPFNIHLKSVVVFSKKKKTLERKDGNLLVNIAGTSLENESSMIDVLKKSPGIIVDPKGNLKIIGKGNNTPLVVIDGIESDMNALNNLSPSQIKTIEIIKNPSAIYSANATSVINVKTYNGFYKGWNFKFSGQITKATFMRYYAGIDLGYNNEKYGFNLYYGYNPFIVRSSDKYNRNFNKLNINLYNSVQNDNNNPNIHFINAKGFYKLNNKTRINFSTINNYNKGKVLTKNYIKVQSDSLIIRELNTNIIDNYSSLDNTNTINLIHEIDTNGLVFNLSSSYSYYNQYDKSNIVQDSSLLKSLSSSNSSLFQAQTSIDVPFKNIKLKTIYGLHYEYINVLGNNETVDTLKTKSVVNENIFASFIQATKTLKKFNFSAGLRLEYAKSKGVQNDSIIFQKDFLNLFPNASVEFNISKNWQLYTSYSYKIDRPNFTSLTSFDEYLDSLSSFKGNANLVPEFSHLFDIGISFMEVASLDFSYTRVNNPIVWFLETDENSIKSALKQRNFDLKNEYSVSLTVPYQTDFWSTYNVFGYLHTDVLSQLEKISLNNNMFYMVLYNEFNYKKYISLNISYQFFTKGMFDIYTFDQRQVLSLGLKSSLFKNRLQLYFNWNDILKTDIYNLSIKTENVDVTDYKFSDSNLFRFGFTYKLNNAFKDLKIQKEKIENLKRLKKDI